MTTETDEVRKDLERFVCDNPLLERLEAILDDFNPFTAMGWTRQEIRHSSFLRWLLDPGETHKLGDYFLRAFLKRVARESEALGPDHPSVFDVDGWEFRQTQVTQEWQNIDLLIRDDADGFVVAIENKVHSGEHSSQLQRYRSLVEQQFPARKRLFAYLTISGDVPSDESYVPVGHGEVASLVATTLERRGDQLSAEVSDFLKHYVQMVRRHIVEDSEIQEICRSIYGKHQRALEVLFEHRPDRASEVAAFLRSLIAEQEGLVEDYSSKGYIRFIPEDLDFLPRVGEGWTRSHRVVLFEIENLETMRLKITLGPGPEDLRNYVHEGVVSHSDVFNRAGQKLYPKWWMFHADPWINKKHLAEMSVEDLRFEIRARFERFMEKDLPRFREALGGLRSGAEKFGG